MTEVIGVRFREEGKTYYFSPNGLTVIKGQNVIVETSRGLEYGTCFSENEHVEDTQVVQPLRPAVRLATREDEELLQENRAKESKAFDICLKKIADHGLDMKLTGVEYTFDGSRVLFFFTSEGRVDFRELVKDLASVLKTRIELRQIGVRDEAKMLGGLGICGRPFCCATFLDDFQPVSIKMAKTQNLSLNPAKISGTCGRLMCCLKYEQEAYDYLTKNTPRVESIVKTPDGKGTIVDVNLLRGQVKVRLDNESDITAMKTYKIDQVTVLRQGGKKTGQTFDERNEPEEEEELARMIEEEEQEIAEELNPEAPNKPEQDKSSVPQNKRPRRHRKKKKPSGNGNGNGNNDGYIKNGSSGNGSNIKNQRI